MAIHRVNADSNAKRLRALAAAGAIAFGWLTTAAAQDVPNGTLAAAIRASDHPCERVLEKEQVSGSQSTWRVRCNSGTFQVTMGADTAATVVRID
jgi:hypothetical protein